MNTQMLRDMYSFAASLPDSHVRLDCYKHEYGDGTRGGRLLGHLSMAGRFGFFLQDSQIRVRGHESSDEGWRSISEILGIKASDLINLVGVRGSSEFDPSGAGLSDKELLLWRFKRFFTIHGIELEPGHAAANQFINKMVGKVKAKI